ncbi:hypothetical protein AAVH_23682 [Aphelenchoides avenae]|nr:hypothetical protein AAVH_23682 [Aphelenchus avenae]
MSSISRRVTFSSVAILTVLTSASSAALASNAAVEYMTKGLYQCTSKYVHTLSKLHALIKEAFEEYTECEHQLREAPGKKPTENELLDRLLAEMDSEEEEGIEETPSPASRVGAAAGLSRSVRARRASSGGAPNAL